MDEEGLQETPNKLIHIGKPIEMNNKVFLKELDKLISYAYKNKVWLVSPTTLISTLTTIEVIMKNIEKDKYASIIHKELNLLSEEFRRYKDRWDKLSRSIDSVSKEVKDLYTTSDKITKRFDSINNVNLIDHKD